jgi:predicted HAD superfamily phosphohydrolase
MLEYFAKNNGTAVSFNGNKFSLFKATVAYSGTSIGPLKELFKAYPKIITFVEHQEKKQLEQDSSKETYFHNMQGCSKEKQQEILQLQLKYRRLLREKAAQLS